MCYNIKGIGKKIKKGDRVDKKRAIAGKTREILREYQIRPAKRLGQNFLIDQNILHKIITAGGVEAADTVIEIGPGLGSLTELILNRIPAGKLYAIEKDQKLVAVLADLLAGYHNLVVINQDVLAIDWPHFFAQHQLAEVSVKVMANLPYYITTPVIMNLLESGLKFKQITLLVQKEVAARMAAAPGGKDYGALSIAVQYHSKVEIVADVAPTVFIPPPQVYSTIISLYPYRNPPVKVSDQAFFFKVVQAIFQQRRKNIKNALSNSTLFSLSKEGIMEGLARGGISPTLRGENLSIAEIAQLSDILKLMAVEQN